MKKEMQLLKKRNGTGMHQTYLSTGSVVRNETLEKRTRVVLRPGNTVLCDPAELGVHGLTQFDHVGPPPEAEPEAAKPPQTLPVIVKREKSNYYDIINPTNPDKPLNEKALRKKEAEAMLSFMPDDAFRRPQIKRPSRIPVYP